MKKILVILALFAVMFSTIPAFATGESLTFTAEVAIPSASFVYRGTTDGYVKSYLQNLADGTAYGKNVLNLGSLSGNVLSAVYLAENTAIVAVEGTTADTLKIVTMPTTTATKYVTVVTSTTLGVKTSMIELVKLSNTKIMVVYKVAGTDTTMYVNTATINSGMTTLTLGTADSTTIGDSIEPAGGRLTATVGVVYYHNDTNMISKTFSTATGTLEVTSTTVKSGDVDEMVNDMHNKIVLSHTDDAAPVINTLTTDNSTMTVATTLTLSHLADTVEIGDIAQLSTTYAVYVYKLGTSTYLQAINLLTEATGEAIIVGNDTTGVNFASNRMLVKLTPTYVAVAVNGQTRVYSLNTITLALTIAGVDTHESNESCNPILYDVYDDTVTTNPAIFRTHTDRPNTCLRKFSYIDYISAPRMGFVTTGVNADETCEVQVDGIVTKTASAVDAGVPLYIDNSNALTESSAGCIDTTPVGKKLSGNSVMLED